MFTLKRGLICKLHFHGVVVLLRLTGLNGSSFRQGFQIEMLWTKFYKKTNREWEQGTTQSTLLLFMTAAGFEEEPSLPRMNN